MISADAADALVELIDTEAAALITVEVTANESDEPRISVAFNTKVTI